MFMCEPSFICEFLLLMLDSANRYPPAFLFQKNCFFPNSICESSTSITSFLEELKRKTENNIGQSSCHENMTSTEMKTSKRTKKRKNFLKAIKTKALSFQEKSFPLCEETYRAGLKKEWEFYGAFIRKAKGGHQGKGNGQRTVFFFESGVYLELSRISMMEHFCENS